MARTLVVKTADGRVPVDDVTKTNWTHDGTLEVLDSDGDVIGEFPTAEWAVVADNLG
jgi:hypothetical protein